MKKKTAIPSLSNPRFFRKGFDHVQTRDERLGKVLQEHGVIRFAPAGELFDSLVESIISQQISGGAADAIIGRVRGIYPGRVLDPRAMQLTPPEKLRAAGVSPQKLSYLKDLSERVVDGRIDLVGLREMEDTEIIRALDEVKGIGPWTAHMFLIFTLGRPDVLPVDDLGIRKGVQRIYGLEATPKRKEIEKIAEGWHPFCTVASLYVWRHKDNGAKPVA